MFTHILGDIGAGPVLFLTNDFPPRAGGIQTFVRQLCDELPPEQVVVYAPAHPAAAEHDAGLPFTVVRDESATLLPTPGLARRVQETIGQHGCRAVVYGASVPLGLLAPRLGRSTMVDRQIALTHGHEVWWAALPGTRRLLRRVARHVDVLTYVSEYTRRRIAPRLGEPTHFVRLSPTAHPRFRPTIDGSPVRLRLGIEPDALVVVCVARLVRRKGQDRLIRIWPAIARQFPGAHLLIVGDGPDRSRLRRMISRRHLDASVTMTGEVDDPAPYYAAGDVFAMPVRNRLLGLEVEALGISYLEAAACGLRVIPGRRGGAVEALLGAHEDSTERTAVGHLRSR